MDTAFCDDTEEYKGKLGGSWQERRAFQLERDGKLIGWVNHFEVLTRELGCALLALPRTPANLKTVERRLRRLAIDGQHFNQIEQDGIVYAVTLAIAPRKKTERAQLAHRLMEARRWACLESVLPIDDKRTARMLRAQGGTLIPDGFCTIGERGFFWEDNVGRDHFEEIPAKAELYVRNHEYLTRLFGVASAQVVWITKIKSRVEKIVDSFAGIGNGRLFLVTHEEQFTPYDPQSILQPIFRCPHDQGWHSFLDEV
jgi:hypothetical protein